MYPPALRGFARLGQPPPKDHERCLGNVVRGESEAVIDRLCRSMGALATRPHEMTVIERFNDPVNFVQT